MWVNDVTILHGESVILMAGMARRILMACDARSRYMEPLVQALQDTYLAPSYCVHTR